MCVLIWIENARENVFLHNFVLLEILLCIKEKFKL